MMNDQLDDQIEDKLEDQIDDLGFDEQIEEQPVSTEKMDQPSVEPAEPVVPKKKELSKGRRIWRTFLIWVAVISLAYLSGMLTLNYLRLQPQTKELTSAYNSIADLEGQVSNLTVQLNDAVEKADSLQDAKTHQEFLQVQLDIRNAQLALAKGDVASASAALAGTAQKLNDLQSEIQAVDAGLAVSLPQRLSLIISGLEDNVDNANIDLGLFASDLQGLIDTIFGN